MERSEREAALRRRLLSGDESAWAELYADHFDSLWVSVARRIGPDRGRIEDAVQEAWLVAVRRIGTFAPSRGSFRAWLHGIAANVVRNHVRLRSRGERTTRSTLDDAGVLADAPHDAGGAESRELMEASWASLPERYRAVLREKYIDELSVEEIARRRDQTPKAVESLLGRARIAFRETYRLLDPDTNEGGAIG